jgi:hypothetical protein
MVKRKKNLKVRNAKEHVYNNIQFRSGLEVYCYKQLIKHGLEANYEQVTMEIIPKFKLMAKWLEYDKSGLKSSTGNVQAMTYTPDFTANDMSWIIECKGYQASDIWQYKRKLIKLHIKDMDVTYYVPSTQKAVDLVIQNILNENKKKTYKNI